jgi:predicted regulator of amino acid metabolism with ACT domain
MDHGWVNWSGLATLLDDLSRALDVSSATEWIDLGVVYVEKASGRVAEIAVKVSGAIARGMNREIPCGHCET